ncbi:MAG: hypothetical protein IK078_00950 [Lachnospiraceae bacterium]|nr:hypothetical protein [Lachnospiraceae bacterium]
MTSGTGKQTSLTYNLYADVPIIENADGYQMEIYDAKGKKIKTVNQKQMDSSVIRIAAKDLKQNGCSVRVRGYRSFQKKKYYSAWSSKRFALRQPMCAARPYRGNLMIRWEAIAGATGYDVYLSDEKMAESFRKVKSVKAKSGQSVYQLTIKKIKKKKFNSGKKYYYYVIAKRKKSGETVFSAKSFKQFIVKM